MTQEEQWIWQPTAPIGVRVIDTHGGLSGKNYPVSRIFCVGRNYEAHAIEMNAEIDRAEPFYFTKTPSAIAPPTGAIPYPPGTEDFHHEVELVIALGGDGFRIAPSDATQIIYGYACGIDFTRRDLQNKAKQGRKPWDLSKDIEYGAVISAIRQWPSQMNLESARIELRVNGQQRQDSDVKLMVWKIPEIIAHLSRFYHLKAGDLIYTGTPDGVGPVQVGDHVQASIAGVGSLDIKIAETE